MPQPRLAPSESVTIDSPLCPKCGSVMWMVHVQPAERGIDKQTFECPVCDISKKPRAKSE
jgi:transposase-like protein